MTLVGGGDRTTLTPGKVGVVTAGISPDVADAGVSRAAGRRGWRHRTAVVRLGVMLMSLAPLSAALAEPRVIRHEDIAAPWPEAQDLRLYFTLRLNVWPDGTPVSVFVFPDNDPLHRQFCKRVLGLYPYQLRRLWDRQIFTGTAQAPVVVHSREAMRARVRATPGALGYDDDRTETEAGPGSAANAGRETGD